MSDILTLFERQVRHLQSRSDDRLLTALPRFVTMVRDEPRLHAVTEDLDRELRRASEVFGETEALLRAQLAAVWDHHAWFVGVLGGIDKSGAPDGLFDVYGGLAEVAERLSAPPIQNDHPNFYEAAGDPTPLGGALRQIDHWTSWLKDIDLDGREDDYRDFVVEVRRIRAHHDRALARNNLLDARSAGAAWLRLRSSAEAVLPLASPWPVSDDVNDLLAAWVERNPSNLVAKLAAGRLPMDEGEEQRRAAMLRRIRTDVEVFAAEMIQRIGLRLSHLALLRRFKTRCQKHDAAALREAFERASQPKEDVLTRAAARYLFDQGLDPIFSAEIVSLRPDLFDTTTRNPLYVEAKWYDGKKMPWSRLKSAPWQVWSTWNDLAGAHHVREVFLLIFRLGGPLVMVPDVVRHRGVSLYPMVIDIGSNSPPKEEKAGRGSKAHEQTKDLPESAFLPVDATTDDD